MIKAAVDSDAGAGQRSSAMPVASPIPQASPLPLASPIPPASPLPEVGSGADSGLPPFAGYDRLDGAEVVADLHKHSQVELTAIESFESSHRDRLEVRHKLRYLRGLEPIPGYDALSREEIAAAIADGDDATLVRVRTYERKFQNRPEVLEPVADALRAHRLAVANA